MRVVARVWIEDGGDYVIGQGGYQLLKAISEESSLRAAADRCGMSYDYAWKKIRAMEKALGCRIVERRRGGPKGGESRLTDEGRRLMELYESVEKKVEELLKEENDGVGELI